MEPWIKQLTDLLIDLELDIPCDYLAGYLDDDYCHDHCSGPQTGDCWVRWAKAKVKEEKSNAEDRTEQR